MPFALLIALLTALRWLAGCLHIPPVANMAMQENRGDLTLAAGYGEGLGVVGSYAVTDHIAVRADTNAVVTHGPLAQYRADAGAAWFWAAITGPFGPVLAVSSGSGLPISGF